TIANSAFPSSGQLRQSRLVKHQRRTTMKVNTQPLIAALVVLSLTALTACTSSPTAPASKTRVRSAQSPKDDDLQAAMDKLEESIHKPSAPFHASFKKSGSDGF